MLEPTRRVPMRGFTAAIARSDAQDGQGAASLSVGTSDDGNETLTALSMRHADGTMLTAWLTDAAVNRLANLLADTLDARTGVLLGATVTLQ